MTCAEQFVKMHADMDDISRDKLYISSCPTDFDYAPYPEYCCEGRDDSVCEKCWNREYSEKKKSLKNLEIDNISHEEKEIPYDQPIDDEHVDTAEFAGTTPVIKDSGNRREFSSGAVRDMQEGKGRFDLVPLEIVSDLLGTKEINHDPIVLGIATFMYDYDTCWLAAALENFAEKAYGGCLYTMFLEVAKHFEAGAKKYKEDNWRLGIPIKCYIDSGVRHYMKWRRGDNDEDHARSFVWNLMCCMWEREYGEDWRRSGGSENCTILKEKD